MTPDTTRGGDARNFKFAVECGEVFALHRRGANKDCPVGRNIEAVLCNLQKAIDHAVDEKLAEYTLGDVLAKIEETVV